MSLVGLYKFDDNVNDDSPTENHGTEVNSPAYVDGVFGKAISAPGAVGFVTLDDNPAYHFAGDFSFAAWVKQRNWGGSEQMVVAKDGTDVSSRSFVFSVGAVAGRIRTLYYHTGGNAHVRLDCDGVFPNDGEFHHIVGLRRGNTLECWVDGVQQTGSVTGTHDTQNVQAGGVQVMRRGRAGLNSPLDGDVDDLRIYDHALLEEEITELLDPYGKPFKPTGRQRETRLGLAR